MAAGRKNKNTLKKHRARARKRGRRGFNRDTGCLNKRLHETIESAMGHAKDIRGTWYSCPWVEDGQPPHWHVTSVVLGGNI